MENPIIKIKRNNILTGATPSFLTESELGVDLVDNKFYVGTSTSTPTLVSTKIVDDALFPVANDTFVPTEKAIKSYITNNYNPQTTTVPPKNVFQMRIPSADIQIFGDQYDIGNFYTQDINFYIDQNKNNFMSIGENINLGQFGTGIYQTVANNMYLHVTYSVVIKSVQSNQIATETNINYWRSFGMYVYDYNNNIKRYYGYQTSPPVIAGPNGLPTMFNGSAIVKLPKYKYGFQTGDLNIDQWELRFFSQTLTSDTLYIGNVPGGLGVNDPPITDNYKIKIDIVELARD